MSESACGKASSDSSSNDKEFVCPTCGNAYDTQHALSTHRGQYCDGVTGVQYTCDWCGCEDTKRPSHYDENGRNFCGRECWAEWNSQHQENKVGYECDYCGGSFQIHPFRLDQADKHFCPDSDCYSKHQSENCVGEKGRNYRGGSVKVECVNCGNEKSVKPHRVEKTEYFVCSVECESEHKQTIRGEAHPQYKPKKPKQYGANWQEQRTKARERDNHRCQDCGKHESDHYRELIVHHITPRSDFIDENGVYDYKTGNRLSNLVSVCDSCHQKWEGIPLKPQLID